ncbi:hypothetical protein DMUE_1624 [Dictyocoela muelleri]|nr:hypothetical protein DMUE_1624 [Dictyocoela muelleri]
MIEDVAKQDLFLWKDEFIQTAKLAGWSDETAANVLKASMSATYFGLVNILNKTEEIIRTLFKLKYPEKDHVKYLNQLSSTKQNNFLRISEFRDEIINIIKKLIVCLDWSQ